MKAIFTVLFLSICTFCFGQDSRLFDTRWYLTTLIINGTNNFPPAPNSEVSNVTLEFDKDNEEIHPVACNGFNGSVIYQTSVNTFSIKSYVATLKVCNIEVNNTFETKYFNFFSANIPNGIFAYNIVEVAGNKALTIINNNNVAVYTNQIIASVKATNVEFAIFPNPTEDNITIKCENKNFTNGQLEIYDNFGKLSLSENLESFPASINVESLPAGIYLLQLKNEDRVTSKKFIKL